MSVAERSALRGALATIGRCEYPALGVAAVILGAFISSLNTRISTFGLADIRGGLGFGFDEGSWITTIFGAATLMAAAGCRSGSSLRPTCPVAVARRAGCLG